MTTENPNFYERHKKPLRVGALALGLALVLIPESAWVSGVDLSPQITVTPAPELGN